MQAMSGQSATWVFPAFAAAALVAAVALGIRIPVIGNGPAAFFVLAFLGAQLCGLAFRVPTGSYSHGWLNPFTVAGIVIGIANLALVGSVIFRYKVPFIPSDQAATLALGASMAVKAVLAMLRSAMG